MLFLSWLHASICAFSHAVTILNGHFNSPVISISLFNLITCRRFSILLPPLGIVLTLYAVTICLEKPFHPFKFSYTNCLLTSRQLFGRKLLGTYIINESFPSCLSSHVSLYTICLQLLLSLLVCLSCRSVHPFLKGIRVYSWKSIYENIFFRSRWFLLFASTFAKSV